MMILIQQGRARRFKRSGESADAPLNLDTPSPSPESSSSEPDLDIKQEIKDMGTQTSYFDDEASSTVQGAGVPREGTR
jgi:hypothetical protein